MSQHKKQTRARFREAVFTRDGFSCVKCDRGSLGKLDAHHITDRNELPNGGYVPENGISLCEVCHSLAEKYHSSGISHPGYSPDELYEAIGSSYDKALRASKRLC